MSTPDTAIILVNLGTPQSPTPPDVGRYLTEFLTDARVIDLPWLKRQLLVRGIIVPRRKYTSASVYKNVWTDLGSPLMFHGVELTNKLQTALGPNFIVKLAMRYDQPSIASVLKTLESQSIEKLVILPLFPQYASATTGSVHQRVMEVVSSWESIPETLLINSYPTEPKMISTFADNARALSIETYDKIIFSYHGLPVRHIKKADRTGKCLTCTRCCDQLENTNRQCYRAQCFATTRALCKELNLSDDRYLTCFQSRLGKDPWIEPYAEDTIRKLAAEGFKRLLVFAPSFTADCLETLDEIGNEYAELFEELGGEKLTLVPSLNSSPKWVEALQSIIYSRLGYPKQTPKNAPPPPLTGVASLQGVERC